MAGQIGIALGTKHHRWVEHRAPGVVSPSQLLNASGRKQPAEQGRKHIFHLAVMHTSHLHVKEHYLGRLCRP